MLNELVSSWDNDLQLFFKSAFSVLDRYKTPGGVYQLKIDFLRFHFSQDDLLDTVIDGWAILETFIALPKWDASFLLTMLQFPEDKIHMPMRQLAAAVAADLTTRLFGVYRKEEVKLSGLGIRYMLQRELHLPKFHQLVDLEATELLNLLQLRAKQLGGAPLPPLHE